MASVYRKVGGSGKQSPYWQAKFRGLDGKQVWLSTKFEGDEKQAWKIADAWEAAVKLAAKQELTQEKASKIVNDMKGEGPKKMTAALMDTLLKRSINEEFGGRDFTAFCEEWLSTRTGAPSTLVKYRSIVERFIESLVEWRRKSPIGSITTGEILRFRTAEIEKGKTAVTANTSVMVLKTVFNTARRQGLCATNPAEAIESLPEDGQERIPFDDPAVRMLLKEADIEWKGMILLGYHSGLRVSDASALTWKNIDLNNQTLSYQPKKTSRRKKPSERTTTIVLHNDLVEYLSGLTVTDQIDAPLFPSLRGLESNGRSGLSKSFTRIMNRANLDTQSEKKAGHQRRFSKLSFHSLRHSFISRLANQEIGHDLRKTMVGHSDDDVHDKYTHLNLDSQRKAIGGLSSVL